MYFFVKELGNFQEMTVDHEFTTLCHVKKINGWQFCITIDNVWPPSNLYESCYKKTKEPIILFKNVTTLSYVFDALNKFNEHNINENNKDNFILNNASILNKNRILFLKPF